jgi:hypothetical protein
MTASGHRLFKGETAIRRIRKATTVLLLICSFFSGAWIDGVLTAETVSPESDQGEHPTNLRLLKIILEEAIEEVCDRLSSHEFSTFCLESPSDLNGRWMVDQILTERLLARGYRVVFRDSLSNETEELCARAGFLRYRIVQMDLDYVSSRRRHLFGPRLVERAVQLDLLFRLSRASGEVVWAGEMKRTGGDWIALRDLPLIEQASPPFLSPRLEIDGWGRLAEPALLTAAVGGLIYLFYSTQ